MTIVVDGDDRAVDQVCRQLYKLIDVVSVFDITYAPMVDRELAMIKVAAQNFNRREILDIVQMFRADVVDVNDDSLIVQVLGDEGKVNAALRMFEPFGILEMVRTGRVAMTRGARTSKPPPMTDAEATAAAVRAMLGRRPEGVLPFASD